MLRVVPFTFAARALAAAVVLAGPMTSASPTGAVHGTVVDAAGGAPLAGAVVDLDGRLAIARSDSTGSFVLTEISTGVHVLEVRRLGYTPERSRVAVRGEHTSEVVVRMRAAPTMLDPLTVRPLLPERETFETVVAPGVLTLSGETRRTAPVALEADVLRDVPMLPGVVARSDRSTGFAVQGGEEDQNLVLLDGIPLFAPDHFGGLFGAFIDGAVDGVRLHEAGFPARYGGRLSSVLEVSSAESARPGAHGTVSVSLLASTVTGGGTFAGARGAWTVAARRTYADLLARAFGAHALPYHFSDGEAHVRYDVSSRTRVTATLYRGLDVLDASLAELQDSSGPLPARLSYDRGNAAAGIAVVHSIGERIVAEQRASVSRLSSSYDQGSGSLRFDGGVRDDELSGFLALGGAPHLLRVGYQYDHYRVRHRLGSPGMHADELSADQRLASLALFAEGEWRPAARLVVQPGVRWERVGAADWSALSPRLAVRYFATPSLAITAAAGEYAQWLHLSNDETATMQLFDYWAASGRGTPVAVARNVVAGVERWFGASRFVRVESYYKRYASLPLTNPAADPAMPSSEFRSARGTSYGATVLLRQTEVGGFGASLSYSYGVTRRRLGDTTFFPLHDRRHSLDALVTIRGRRGTFGARFTYGSGTPYTAVVGEVQTRAFDPATGTWLPGDPLPVPGARDARRYPAYARLDLGISRAYRWRGATLTPSFDVVNAFDHRNVFRYFAHYDTTPPTRATLTQIPFLPSLGLRVDF